MTTARRQPRQLRSRQTVDWVLEAAAQLFRDHGHAGTTTNKVAERAGVSIGSVYQYFPDKDALLAALAERHLDQAAEAAAAAVADAAGADLPAVVDTLVRRVAELHTAAPGLHALMAREALTRPRLLDRLAAAEGAVAAALAVELRRLGAGGEDPETVALLAVQGMNAQIHGAVLHPPAHRTAADLVGEIVTLWTAALTAAR